MPFPTDRAGPPVAEDAGDGAKVYLGSVILERAVIPCKIIPRFTIPPLVGINNCEFHHRGRYDLLVFNDNTMEWVATSYGQVPLGRHPVEGGYDEYGAKLYHAIVKVRDEVQWATGRPHTARVPGKTGSRIVSEIPDISEMHMDLVSKFSGGCPSAVCGRRMLC